MELDERCPLTGNAPYACPFPGLQQSPGRPLVLLKVGVFTGYSSAAMALALPPHGRLVACDRDAKAMALARQYWEVGGCGAC